MNDAVSVWGGDELSTREAFIVAKPGARRSFRDQIDGLFSDYRAKLDRHGLDQGSALTVTFFVSDAANQEEELRDHPAFCGLEAAGAAISVLQQPPVGAKIGMAAYHVERKGMPVRRQLLPLQGVQPQGRAVSVETPGYRFVYFKHLLSASKGDEGWQTDALMGASGLGLLSDDLALSDVVRTWLFIHDIDRHYQGVSQARNALFDRHGVSVETGFPASTGIEGRTSDHNNLLMMDALTIQGLKPGQSQGMSAPTHMNPTVEYGVTFERGRSVTFGDRRHLYISGTASIDNQGRILHVGDAARQTERAVENVRALLSASRADLTDMRLLLVYLRDPVDAPAVEAVLAASGLAATPRLMVRAPVCRPGWLVEIEGVAIDGKGHPDFLAF